MERKYTDAELAAMSDAQLEAFMFAALEKVDDALVVLKDALRKEKARRNNR